MMANNDLQLCDCGYASSPRRTCCCKCGKPFAPQLVSCDRIGWDAIQHKDGWWVGTEKGVTCYGDHELARVALTIIWQREGGRQLDYRIKPFTGANAVNGEHTPKLSAADAMNRFEAKYA
jgi:hypothetical protein